VCLESGLGAPLPLGLVEVRILGFEAGHEAAPGGGGQLVGGMLGSLGIAAYAATQICIAMVKRHRGSLKQERGFG